MTEQAPHTTTQSDAAFDRVAQKRLSRLISLARYVLVLERMLQPLIFPLSLLLLFALLAFAGLFDLMADRLRIVVLVLFLLAFLASLIPMAQKRFPEKKEAVARLDLQVPHTRVIAALNDRLSQGSQPSELWHLHRARMLALLPRFRLFRPVAMPERGDRYGFRFLLPLLMIVAAIAAGPQRFVLLGQAFTGKGASAAPPRLDAWITPPLYTGRAPVFLNIGSKEALSDLSVPQGSLFALRTQSGQGIELKVGQVIAPALAEDGGENLSRFEHRLTETAPYQIRHFGRVLASGMVDVVPDAAPQIKLEKPAEILSGNSLRLRVGMSDDYGIVSAEALFVPQHMPLAVNLSRLPAPQPLVANPSFALSLGGTRPRTAQSVTTKDLSEHPFAGLPMQLVLIAKDDAGNIARTEAGRIIVPEPSFQHPLARGLAGLRQSLARDKFQAGAVYNGLELILSEPEKRIEKSQVFLQLAALRAQLANARSDDELRDVVSRMWDVANMIENGDLSEAERALKEAQAKLEAAIEKGASPEEISKLMQDLRQAMAKYLQQMQAQAQKSGKPPGALPPNAQMLSEADIENMMKRIEELSRSGAKDAARQQLQALRDMLNALKNSDPSASAAAGAMQQKLNDIADVMREQQKLMDETFQARNKQRQNDGKANSADTEKLQQLENRQSELRERLGNLRDGLPPLGSVQNGGKPEDSLGAAEGAMGGAEEKLQQTAPSEALPQQGQALEQMRKGAQALMRALNGKGQGQGGQYGYNQGESQGNLDAPAQYNPFSDGSESGEHDLVPNEAERKTIQDILDEVKRRLSDPGRARDERDYLERLLSPF